MMKIEALNPVVCRVERQHFQLILPALSCKAEYFRKERIPGTDRFRQVRYEYDKNFFIEKKGDFLYFYRGHLERVQQYLEDVGLEPAEIFVTTKENIYHQEYKLNGIKFRPDQIELMDAALNEETGVILSPTGSGKTILQLGIMSAFPTKNILLLSHTIDIIQQTFEELQKYGFDGIQQIGGGKKYDGKFGRIVVSTIQSIHKIDPNDYRYHFTIVMVDEAHRVSATDNMYAEVLRNLMAPIRLGFTATEPTSELGQMAMEGLLGPVIGEVTIEEAVELDILAKPRVKLLKTPYSPAIKQTKKYADVYQRGIVENNDRNNLIAHTIMGHSHAGDISLIFVNRIEHGTLIQKKFADFGMNVPFIRGDMQPKERLNIKHSLIEKRSRIAIATTAWREGVNIPSLDVIFNAGGGKDELGVLQLIGRGLRRTDDKETVTIYDIFDPSHPYLISHFGERVTLYMEKEWL